MDSTTRGRQWRPLVVVLEYPLKVCPMPGIWVQSVPVIAIPWGGMNTEQRNTLQRNIRGQDD